MGLVIIRIARQIVVLSFVCVIFAVSSLQIRHISGKRAQRAIYVPQEDWGFP